MNRVHVLRDRLRQSAYFPRGRTGNTHSVTASIGQFASLGLWSALLRVLRRGVAWGDVGISILVCRSIGPVVDVGARSEVPFGGRGRARLTVKHWKAAVVPAIGRGCGRTWRAGGTVWFRRALLGV